MLLEKFTTLQDKATCLEIIRYLIEKYPKIDMFQREKCAKLIHEHFEQLIDEYQVIENWKEETIKNMDWKKELVNSIKQNDADFLVKFNIQKLSNLEELKIFLSETNLIDQSIDHGRFESFVEIFETIDIQIYKVAVKLFSSFRPRMLKYFLNHDKITRIDPYWMKIILWKMEDKEIDIDSNVLKCFHIVLNHPKYDVNEQIA
jgi:hypothetical protein